MTYAYPFKEPAAASILRRIQAFGYDVTAKLDGRKWGGLDRLELRASDARTGEHHSADALLVNSEDEVRCASALAELVASEMEG